MKAAEDAAILEADVDVSKDTITPAQTAHPRKVFAQTQETTPSIVDTM